MPVIDTDKANIPHQHCQLFTGYSKNHYDNISHDKMSARPKTDQLIQLVAARLLCHEVS